MAQAFQSVYHQTFDVVVFGAGYAGFAAAVSLHRAGQRVLLVERRAAALWESGWAFAQDAGSSADPLWRELIGSVERRGGADGRRIDGAIAEVVASDLLGTGKLPVLYYVAPIGAAVRDGRLERVAVATKGGVREIVGGRWIDATQSGELLALLDRSWRAPSPRQREIALFLRHTDWRLGETELRCEALAGASLRVEKTLWANERVLRIALPGGFARPRSAWVGALGALRQTHADAMDGAVMTHGSVVPLDSYSADPAPARPAQNVAMAIAGACGRPIATLAQRFELGLEAATDVKRLAAAPAGDGVMERRADWPAMRQERAQVVVAGAGTGGAFAAIAAARQGADVLAIEPLPFVGGIGAGGGIHWYYFGVKGGLQEEADERMRRIAPLFGKTAQVAGYHPDCRKAVLKEMVCEAGVRVWSESMLYSVSTGEGQVRSAGIATTQGPARVQAEAWIDGTGDGDLAALAGASAAFSRDSDGQLHAYSQSSGRASLRDGRVRMDIINYDAGFVDPTDSEDLTRARLVGISHYLQQSYTDLERPTYIAPALGLRQGRQIQTDYQVTLADLIERRRFADAVGYTGCHYDNHAIDYEFESDEAMFWVWCCRQWSGRTACELPYRMLLPRGLDNVWMACRAAGVTMDAHHSIRMQRDLHRLGEVAGLAATMSAKGRLASRAIPMEQLRARLTASGALVLKAEAEKDPYGPATDVALLAPTSDAIAQWIAQATAAPGPAMWHLYRAGDLARGSVMEMLASPQPGVSFRAACVVAMWGDAAAEARLLAALRWREYGFDDVPEKERPEMNNRAAPHWLVAATLLRRCGTVLCLRDLHELACDGSIPHNARTAIALTCHSLLQRLKLSVQERNGVLETLRKLLSTPAPNTAGHPQRKVVQTAPAGGPLSPTQRPPVVEDFAWQLHLAVARAEQAAGAPVHPEARAFLVDPRALVRRAFGMVLQRY